MRRDLLSQRAERKKKREEESFKSAALSRLSGHRAEQNPLPNEAADVRMDGWMIGLPVGRRKERKMDNRREKKKKTAQENGWPKESAGFPLAVKTG